MNPNNKYNVFFGRFSDPSFAEVRKSANDRYSAAIPPEEKVEGSVEQVPACLGDHVARDVFSLGTYPAPTLLCYIIR